MRIYSVPDFFGAAMRLHRVRSLTFVLTFAAACSLAHAHTSVPYVGCSGDGQTGPYAAAKGPPKPVHLPQALADQLAWFEYNGDAGRFGTLGPRGWNCFASIGSSGWTLYIAPDVLDNAKLLEHRNWKGFSGPVIQFSGSDGGTSGRFEVAKVVARVFPAHRAYARSIIAEGFGPTSDYPFPLRPPHLQRQGSCRVHHTCTPKWPWHDVLASPGRPARQRLRPAHNRT